MVYVGQREMYPLNLSVLLQHRIPHPVQRVLHRGTVVVGQSLEYPALDSFPHPIEIQIRIIVLPLCAYYGGEYAVVCLG